MAVSKSGRFWTASFLLTMGMPVWAETAPVAGLQPYQKMALQAAIGHNGKDVVNSMQSTPYRTTILAAGGQDLMAKGPLLSADTTLLCVIPLHKYQAESAPDKGIGRQTGLGFVGAMKTLPSAPVCRDLDRRP